MKKITWKTKDGPVHEIPEDAVVKFEDGMGEIVIESRQEDGIYTILNRPEITGRGPL